MSKFKRTQVIITNYVHQTINGHKDPEKYEL